MKFHCIGYLSNDNLSSGDNGQYFRGSGVAKEYLDDGYPGQDLLSHVPVIIYSPIIKFL